MHSRQLIALVLALTASACVSALATVLSPPRARLADVHMSKRAAARQRGKVLNQRRQDIIQAHGGPDLQTPSDAAACTARIVSHNVALVTYANGTSFEVHTPDLHQGGSDLGAWLSVRAALEITASE
tara:strand:- start:1071 stop:1451 length:381 start_codon:yes stop_codon:yes gene_type:complete